MRIFFLVLAIIYVVSAAWSKHVYKTDYWKRQPNVFGVNVPFNFGWFLGSVLSFCIEGLCWWYIVTQLLVK